MAKHRTLTLDKLCKHFVGQHELQAEQLLLAAVVNAMHCNNHTTCVTAASPMFLCITNGEPQRMTIPT